MCALTERTICCSRVEGGAPTNGQSLLGGPPPVLLELKSTRPLAEVEDVRIGVSRDAVVHNYRHLLFG